jgi:transposase-like protein
MVDPVGGLTRRAFIIFTVLLGVGAVFPSTSVLPSPGQLLQQGLVDMVRRDRKSAADAMATLLAAGTARATYAALAGLSAGPWGARQPAVVKRWRTSLAQLAPFFALAPRRRWHMLSADDAAERMHARLRRAVGRHGCFDDVDAAVSFLDETLRRSERDFCARQVRRQARLEHLVSGANLSGRAQAYGS